MSINRIMLMKKLLSLSLTIVGLGAFSTNSFAFSTADLIKSHCLVTSGISMDKKDACVNTAITNIDFYLKMLNESSVFMQKGKTSLARGYVISLGSKVSSQYKLVDLDALNLLPVDVIEEKKEIKKQFNELKSSIDSGNYNDFLSTQKIISSDLRKIQAELK